MFIVFGKFEKNYLSLKIKPTFLKENSEKYTDIH
jgi:hypothetical protein